MTVVPRASVLSNIPNVVKIVARGYRALSNPIDTIHMHGIPLPNAMPVSTRTVVFELVDNSDIDRLPKT